VSRNPEVLTTRVRTLNDAPCSKESVNVDAGQRDPVRVLLHGAVNVPVKGASLDRGRLPDFRIHADHRKLGKLGVRGALKEGEASLSRTKDDPSPH
jgi:hypothetical protein